MDKTEFLLLDGKTNVEIVIPVSKIEISNDAMNAHTNAGVMYIYPRDVFTKCNMEVRQPLQKPSPETIKKIKEFARKYSKGVETPLNRGVRDYNVGNSDYSKHRIQPWDIWKEYHLDPWRADIVKRILRTKAEDGMSIEESQKLDLQKIKHICDELISHIDEGYHF